MRFLLAEDDQMIGESVQRGLRQDGYAVDWVRDGLTAERALADHAYDLVLLALGLPRKDGFRFLEDLRRQRNRIPVLVITARDAVADRVRGLDAGADDYLVKPIDFDELSARIRALVRRQSGRAEPEVLIGDLRVNLASHEVFLANVPIALSAREFSLLRTLIEQAGVPCSRAQLEERIYGWNEEVESNAVEVHIYSLRRKLGSTWIRNLRGVGYFVPRQP
ncbi:MAG: response regulator [Betaproteobacteria bacterium]|nr:response regulator [Betaproteobacteria bacterium]